MGQNLTGKKIKNTYQWLLHVGATAIGALTKVSLGNGTDSALSISDSAAKVDGDLTVTGNIVSESLRSRIDKLIPHGSVAAKRKGNTWFVSEIFGVTDRSGVSDFSSDTPWAHLKLIHDRIEMGDTIVCLDGEQWAWGSGLQTLTLPDNVSVFSGEGVVLPNLSFEGRGYVEGGSCYDTIGTIIGNDTRLIVKNHKCQRLVRHDRGCYITFYDSIIERASGSSSRWCIWYAQSGSGYAAPIELVRSKVRIAGDSGAMTSSDIVIGWMDGPLILEDSDIGSRKSWSTGSEIFQLANSNSGTHRLITRGSVNIYGDYSVLYSVTATAPVIDLYNFGNLVVGVNGTTALNLVHGNVPTIDATLALDLDSYRADPSLSSHHILCAPSEKSLVAGQVKITHYYMWGQSNVGYTITHMAKIHQKETGEICTADASFRNGEPLGRWVSSGVLTTEFREDCFSEDYTEGKFAEFLRANMAIPNAVHEHVFLGLHGESNMDPNPTGIYSVDMEVFLQEIIAGFAHYGQTLSKIILARPWDAEPAPGTKPYLNELRAEIDVIAAIDPTNRVVIETNDISRFDRYHFDDSDEFCERAVLAI